MISQKNISSVFFIMLIAGIIISFSGCSIIMPSSLPSNPDEEFEEAYEEPDFG